MPSYRAALLYLAVLTRIAYVLADSSVFSQFIGSTVAPVPTLSDDLASSYFTICTNYIHGLPALSDLPVSESMNLEQIAVDGVCQFCTSVGQSRIDSCCAQATSSACFDQFAAANAGRTTPASASAEPTALTTGTSGPTASSSSNGGIIVQNKDLIAGSFIGAVVGVVGWIL
ncbi:hypothetical protein AYO21_01888 [Fonsecaea monophora]|uniref:Uncharacterized protein n=1 Tax=Fonsecaea monophora TaxID=254056 RepID=A0A177FK04_9EURO|nr:hypothetical protein AYO21_01888 [Fonsecaea monophora]KAH0845476.1 hypothetical protein FOPE_12525 [Fonsecaea pedrosoi]OAG44036.1 hypothetical protein AYO21_01888 [Fonsecaea monophora]